MHLSFPQRFARVRHARIHASVADPGFGLREGVDFVNRGGGRKSLKVLKVEVKVILACFGHISINIVTKTYRERSKNKKN